MDAADAIPLHITVSEQIKEQKTKADDIRTLRSTNDKYRPILSCEFCGPTISSNFHGTQTTQNVEIGYLQLLFCQQNINKNRPIFVVKN